MIAVALLALQIYALIDLSRADSREVRIIPKWLWAVLWLIPVIGPAAWLLLGRPAVGPSPGGGSGGGGTLGGPRPPRGPIAPDDDADFLKRLDEQSWAARMERLRRERERGIPGATGDPGAGPGPATTPPGEGTEGTPAADDAPGESPAR